MKQVDATPAAIAIAVEEMKDVLAQVSYFDRSYAKWNELREDFLAGYVSDAVVYLEESGFINHWLTKTQ
jgi:hypothetical protein